MPLETVIYGELAGSEKDDEADETLLGAALQGEAGAWDALQLRLRMVIARAMAASIRRRAFRPLAADVENMIAEVWLVLLEDECRVLKEIHSQRGRYLAARIAAIATATAERWLQAGSYRYPGLPAPDAQQLGDRRPFPRIPRNGELVGKLRRGMLRLSKDDRLFLRHYIYHQGAPRAVAQALGISVSAVHSRKRRITRRLVRATREANRVASPAHG